MCSQVITNNEFPEFGLYYFSFYGVFELTSFQDHFYLDVNDIIRNCSINGNENAHLHITERQICVDVFNYIDNLFSMIKPRRLLFLAIDGVTPRAEMHYQQSLRFLTAKDAEEAKQNDLSKGKSCQKINQTSIGSLREQYSCKNLQRH